MKKLIKVLALMLIFSTLFSLVSCKKNKNGDGGDGFVWDPDPYEDLGAFLTLPDYKSYTISQAFIDSEINIILASLYEEQTLYIDVTSGRGVRKWDYVKLDFSSITVGGETLYPVPEGEEGVDGINENFSEFTVGTGAALPDFENAVLDMTLSSEKEITFTFSDDYTAVPECAGKEGVFKFKLASHGEPPVLDDDICHRFTPYPTPDAMRQALEQEIIYTNFWDYMYEKSVLKARPEKEYGEYYNGFVDVLKSYAKNNGKTLEEYVTTEGQNFPSMGLYEGITMDEFYRLAEEYADNNLKNDLILYSLIRAEGLQTSGGLYDAAQRELLLSYGIGYTIDSLYEQYGKEQTITSIMDIQVRKRVIKYVTKTA